MVYSHSDSEIFLKWRMEILYRKRVFLITEIYKPFNGLFPSIMSEIFEEQGYLYSLKNPRTLITKCESTVKLGIDSIVFKRPKIWQTFAKEVRNSQPLSILITNIKNFWEIICQCKTWKTCIQNLEYTH